MNQINKNGKVYTYPAQGKLLREKGSKRTYSKAVDYEGSVPEYEEVEPEGQADGE